MDKREGKSGIHSEPATNIESYVLACLRNIRPAFRPAGRKMIRAVLILIFLLALSPTHTSGETINYTLHDISGEEVIDPAEYRYDLGESHLRAKKVTVGLEGQVETGFVLEQTNGAWRQRFLYPKIKVTLGNLSETTDTFWNDGTFDVDLILYEKGAYDLAGQGSGEVSLEYYLDDSWIVMKKPNVWFSYAQLNVEVAPPAQKPTVTTLPATDIEQTSAELNGIIDNDGNAVCQYRFQYWKQGQEGDKQSTKWTGSKTTGESFSIIISSLDPGCLYYFESQAKNSKYTSSGGQQFFSTEKSLVVIFEDTFGSTKIDSKKWAVVNGATIDDVGENEPSPDYSLRLNGYPSGGDWIESKIIDLSSYSGAILNYYYQQTGGGSAPGTGDDLSVDYWDGSEWQQLAQHFGSDPSMDYYKLKTVNLPSGAMHKGFRFVIQSKGTPGADDWFVDDVKIVEAIGDIDVYPVKLTASDGEPGEWFGQAVAVCGDYIMVGAYRDDDNGERSGSAYVFKRTADGWKQQNKILAPDGQAGDYFGSAVSMSGDFAIIGADGYDERRGAAYIFRRNGEIWQQQAKLTAPDSQPYANFGRAVSIAGDYAVVGAWSADSVYIFKRNGQEWTLQQTRLNVQSFSVLINEDRAIVGPEIFIRSGENWILETDLTSLVPTLGASGASISGDYAIVNEFIFEFRPDGWQLQRELVPSDAAMDNMFGESVSISGDHAVVAARYDDDKGEDSGAAYIFGRTPVLYGTTWSEQAKLTAPDGEAGDYFGWRVSICGDYVVAGVPGDDDNGEDSGAAYIFRRTDSTWTP